MRSRYAIFAGVGAAALVLGLAAPAGAAPAHTERFLFVETNPTSNTGPVSATGPIHALGTDHQLKNNRDNLVFPKGSVLISHSATSDTQSFDKTTCTARFTEQGTYRVLSGTGAYSKVAGHGTYQLTGYIIGCNENKPPSTQSIVIDAAGPLTY